MAWDSPRSWWREGLAAPLSAGSVWGRDGDYWHMVVTPDGTVYTMPYVDHEAWSVWLEELPE